MLVKWINFLMFVSIIIYVARKPVKQFLAERAEKIQKDLAETAALLADIEKKNKDYSNKLVRVHQEVEQLKSEMRVQGDMEKQHIMTRAKEYVQKIRGDALRVGDQELNRARFALEQKTMQLSIRLAKQWLERSVAGEDHKRLLEFGIEKIKGLS